MIVAKEEVSISLKLPKRELELFDEAIKKCRRFSNRSDALRYLIRRFVDEQSVTPRQVVEHPEKKAVLEAEQR